jgi:hypothetical protein
VFLEEKRKEVGLKGERKEKRKKRRKGEIAFGREHAPLLK